LTARAELVEERRLNHKGNLEYIDYYVDWMLKVGDREWSWRQNSFIDSILSSARKFAKGRPELYRNLRRESSVTRRKEPIEP
jgi:hypothetical protein